MYSIQRCLYFICLTIAVTNNVYAIKNAGILPFATDPNGQCCFLLGKREARELGYQWFDFVGYPNIEDTNEIDVATRTFEEQTNYFALSGNDTKDAFKQRLRNSPVITFRNYNMYFIKIKYFNTNKFKDIRTEKKIEDYVWVSTNAFLAKFDQVKNSEKAPFDYPGNIQVPPFEYKGNQYHLNRFFRYILFENFTNTQTARHVFDQVCGQPIQIQKETAEPKKVTPPVQRQIPKPSVQSTKKIASPQQRIMPPKLRIPTKPVTLKTAGILPYASYEKQCYFLLNQKEDRWADFSGSVSQDNEHMDLIQNFNAKTNYLIHIQPDQTEYLKSRFSKDPSIKPPNYTMYLIKIRHFDIAQKPNLIWIPINIFFEQFKQQSGSGQGYKIQFNNNDYKLDQSFAHHITHLLIKYPQGLNLHGCTIQVTEQQSPFSQSTILQRQPPAHQPSAQPSKGLWEKFLDLLEWLKSFFPSFS